MLQTKEPIRSGIMQREVGFLVGSVVDAIHNHLPSFSNVIRQ
jgi:hypothetical protein